MKIKEIRDLTLQELQTRRRDIKQEQFHLRMQQQAGQMEKPSQLRSLRRDVARIESVLSQRRLAAAKPAAPAATRIPVPPTSPAATV
jgi:large subunit ribosomal protein L29